MNRPAAVVRRERKRSGERAGRGGSVRLALFDFEEALTVFDGLAILDQHLNDAAVDQIDVRWPDAAGTTQTFRHLDGDARWKLKMGVAEPMRL